jgi:lipopolysaccharide biosynthesis glycosyltransferase
MLRVYALCVRDGVYRLKKMGASNHTSSKEPLNIAFCANNRFLPGLAVALHSTLLHLPYQGEVCVHVIDAGLSDDSKASLCECYTNRSDIKIDFLDSPRDLFDAIVTAKYHISAYLRLALPKLLNVNSVVYLDSDMIVFDDVRFLIREIDRSRVPLAAVPDWETKTLKQDSEVIAARVKMEACNSYFNSGLMALNLNLLRSEGFTERALDLLGDFGEHAGLADQTAFNALLAERWHALPSSWNMPSWAFDEQQNNKLPSVLHYTNSAPWLKRRYTPSQALFERIAGDLGVDLPEPEISLLRSCLEALVAWVLAPVRVLYHMIRAVLGKASGRRERAHPSVKIACHWFHYYIGGPSRVVRYWKRIREINSPLFDPFVS